MDIIYIICLAPLVIFIGIFLYLTIIRKNAFEERLVLFRPTHQLSQKRKTYMQGAHKYRKYASIALLVLFSFLLLILIFVMFKEDFEEIGSVYMVIFNKIKKLILFVLLALIPIVLAYYLATYVLKRNEKAQRMFLEQMSDTDFETLLKVRDSLPSISKYSPPFVLCNKKLYIFLFYAIRKIDPTQITEINWENNKNSIFIRLKSPKRTMFTLSPTTFSYFLPIVEQYTKPK
ncbi:hypothetical protein HMPREF1977_1813 [Capnocytophaga ochracea F0287]|uniref:Uncharacterized protein n=1 Tax=Capnocytophaga ochracea F0287 TaxID=873517 RepID=E4MTU1_CAPOC|nr:hypothetical protein [Capnocytophaga ochracea]EFS96897.1 hypothetical protein HMPREF1977_1813 [Capnocytophaga ochracea F0287]UEB42564.1 hypothetical protein LK419_07020 [Capnocytophaga ochracea]